MQLAVPRVDRQPVSLAHASTLALVSILVLALTLRLWGLTWGLPWAFHPDEVVYAERAAVMVRTGDPNPRYFTNPSLFMYMLAGELLVLRTLGPAAGPFALDTPGAVHLLARVNSAVLGTLGVGLVFLIGAMLFSRRVGLVAALLLAVSFLHVRDSHYGVNDVPALTMLLLAVSCIARLLREPSPRWYVLAGLCGGLATSTKYNMGFFVAPLLAAHVACWWRHSGAGQGGRPGPRALQTFVVPLLLAGAGGAAGFLLGTPYAILEFEAFWNGFRDLSELSEAAKTGQRPESTAQLYLSTLVQGLGLLPCSLAIAGLFLAWWTRRVEALVVAVLPLVYLLFMVPKPRFYARMALPLLPFLSVFAAYGALRLADALRPGYRWMVLAILLVAAVIPSLMNDLRHNWLITQPDTRLLAAEWAGANLPPRSVLAIEGRSLREVSAQSREITPEKSRLRLLLIRGESASDQEKQFVERNVEYVMTSSFIHARCLIEQSGGQQQMSRDCINRRLHPGIGRQLLELVRYSPGIGGREVAWRAEDVYTPFWNLEEYERPGPTVRVYLLQPLVVGSP